MKLESSLAVGIVLLGIWFVGRSSLGAAVGVAVGVLDDCEVAVAVGVLDDIEVAVAVAVGVVDKLATVTVVAAEPRFTFPTP
jgi:hypothetical protein